MRGGLALDVAELPEQQPQLRDRRSVPGSEAVGAGLGHWGQVPPGARNSDAGQGRVLRPWRRRCGEGWGPSFLHPRNIYGVPLGARRCLCWVERASRVAVLVHGPA